MRFNGLREVILTIFLVSSKEGVHHHETPCGMSRHRGKVHHTQSRRKAADRQRRTFGAGGCGTCCRPRRKGKGRQEMVSRKTGKAVGRSNFVDQIGL